MVAKCGVHALGMPRMRVLQGLELPGVLVGGLACACSRGPAAYGQGHFGPRSQVGGREVDVVDLTVLNVARALVVGAVRVRAEFFIARPPMTSKGRFG